MTQHYCEVSDGDNSYRIPCELVDKFYGFGENPYEHSTDEWYNWNDNFDYIWSQYQI